MLSRKPIVAIIAAVVAVILLAVGFAVGAASGVGKGSGVSYALQDTVLKNLENSYYKAFDPSALENDAINGMVGGLDDPYTVYLDPQEYANLNADLSGSYSGIGLEEEIDNGFITTVMVFKGGPAADAGIQVGDIIVSVDGVSTAGLTLDQVAAKLLGKSGTTVTIGIYRPPASYEATTTTTNAGAGATTSTTTAGNPSALPAGGTNRDYVLVRRTITIPEVDTETVTANGKNVAHITFSTFAKGSAATLRAAVDKAVNVDKVAAVVLDFRGNGGGLLDEGVSVASIFIQDGVIVTTKGLHSPERVYRATGVAFAQIPLYLLVDQHTASASEIVAGALQDYKRATLIGVTTFGKGLVQSIDPLPNSGAVKITTAEYFTPKGRNINKTGITPDVQVQNNPSAPSVDAPLQEALRLIGNSTSSASPSGSTNSTSPTTSTSSPGSTGSAGGQ